MSLYFHPKVLAAACLHMAARWRMNNKIDPGMPLRIEGHPWFKWIDAAIEQPQINEAIEILRVMYHKEAPKVQQAQPSPSVEISSNV